MSGHLAVINKALSAHITSVRLLPCVPPGVHRQLRLLPEILPAELAVERLLARVTQHVPLQVTHIREVPAQNSSLLKPERSFGFSKRLAGSSAQPKLFLSLSGNIRKGFARLYLLTFDESFCTCGAT